jgi:hypothetical protein
MSALLPLAIQNAELLAALLADVQYWHDMKNGGWKATTIKASPPDLSPSVLYYRDRAISQVRGKVGSLTGQDGARPDDALITAVAFMMGTDVSISHDSIVFDHEGLTGGHRRTPEMVLLIMLMHKHYSRWLR